MPIYAYKCESCGHAKDVLQKMSDAPLTECPQCGTASFTKQVTAAGFQLKGSGWYVTDFRGGDGGGTAKAAVTPGTDSKAADISVAAPGSAPAASSPAPAPVSSGAGAASSAKAE
ncbi:FmdB family zinc ribbon protein [Polaromonas jejuensis]|uniref:FmdB family zinc ribbon protein n=1 Tax=Polaromonas jejuensis TaxID=457502 RepID=A0ABW0Q9L1_9BURK|nr:FmdB family zinc ribbon protein [Polaromonas jejuensis]